jgi:hypothetical protein
MTRPLVQIKNAETGEEIVREMNDVELSDWQTQVNQPEPEPTKEELLAQVQALTAKIQALE